MLGRSYCCLNVSAPISNTGEGEFRWNATTTLEFRCAYPKLANSHFEKSRGHNLDSRCGRRRVPLPPISSRTSRWGEGCPRVQQRHTQLQPGGSASVTNQTSFLFPGASLAPVAPERPRGRRPFPPRRRSPPPSLAQRPVLAAPTLDTLVRWTAALGDPRHLTKPTPFILRWKPKMLLERKE
jgi:hypothetical protein